LRQAGLAHRVVKAGLSRIAEQVHRREGHESQERNDHLDPARAHGLSMSRNTIFGGDFTMEFITNNTALTGKIIAAAVEVHKHLGPGLLDSAYEECLCCELGLRGLKYQNRKPMPIRYKGVKMDCGYRLDILVEDTIAVEVIAEEKRSPMQDIQLLTHMRLSGIKNALLINFSSPVLSRGITRFAL
jgi:GxxExxY protein